LGCTTDSKTVANPPNGDLSNIRNCPGNTLLTAVTLALDAVIVKFIG
jgi:hypothetical protein